MASLAQKARRVAFSPTSEKPNPYSFNPGVERISRSQPIERFIHALERDGCVIVSDFTDIQTLDQADKEVRPWLDQQSDGAKVGGKSFLPILLPTHR